MTNQGDPTRTTSVVQLTCSYGRLARKRSPLATGQPAGRFYCKILRTGTPLAVAGLTCGMQIESKCDKLNALNAVWLRGKVTSPSIFEAIVVPKTIRKVIEHSSCV